MPSSAAAGRGPARLPAAKGRPAPAPAAAKGGAPRPGGWGNPGAGWGVPAGQNGYIAAGHIAHLMDMGFSEEVSKKALAECVWDVNKALDLLLTRAAAEDNSSSKTASGAEGLVPNAADAADLDAALPVDSAWRKPAAAAPAPAPAAASKQKAVKGAVHDSVDASTTASTASSPRSAGRAEQAITAATAKNKEAAISRTSASKVGGSKARDTPSTPTSAASLASSSNTPVAEATSPESVGELERRPAAVVEAPAPVKAAETLAPVADKVSDAVEQAPAPAQNRKLERVVSTWVAEDINVQLSVEQDQFIRCWVDTRTEIGWIYAESLDSSKSGWLPTFVLDQKQLPAELRYMHALSSVPPEHDTQLNVVAGTVLKVHHGSRTSQTSSDGWAYAETVAASGDKSSETQAGWVPVFCLEWAEL